MRRLVIALSVLAVLILALPSTALAQGAPASKGDVAISYSILHDSDLEETFGVGWLVSGAGHLNKVFSVVGEVGGNYKTIAVFGTDVHLSVHSFLGGLRLRNEHSAKAVPFAQVLTGVSRASAGALGESNSSSAFTIQPGAGVDIQLRSNVSLRAQADFRIIRSEGETSNEFRAAAGVAFRLGK
jgi:opacity protein-like surface antigen